MITRRNLIQAIGTSAPAPILGRGMALASESATEHAAGMDTTASESTNDEQGGGIDSYEEDAKLEILDISYCHYPHRSNGLLEIVTRIRNNSKYTASQIHADMILRDLSGKLMGNKTTNEFYPTYVGPGETTVHVQPFINCKRMPVRAFL